MAEYAMSEIHMKNRSRRETHIEGLATSSEEVIAVTSSQQVLRDIQGNSQRTLRRSRDSCLTP